MVGQGDATHTGGKAFVDEFGNRRLPVEKAVLRMYVKMCESRLTHLGDVELIIRSESPAARAGDIPHCKYSEFFKIHEINFSTDSTSGRRPTFS